MSTRWTIEQPFNVGHGGPKGRFMRLCLAAMMHPAGVVTRHNCRVKLLRKLRPRK